MIWEDNQYDPEYWEEEFYLDGDQELNFRAARHTEEQPETEDVGPDYAVN